MSASASSLLLANSAAEIALRMGGDDVVALDVSGPLPFADVFLLVTGTSERNVSAIAREIEDGLADEGYRLQRREGREEGRWVLLDFGDLVVHVFHQEDRAYYALERLWRDCPVVPLNAQRREDAG